MTKKELKYINGVTEEWHDTVASINEEFVDGNEGEVKTLCKGLVQKVNAFLDNLNKTV
jgi:hypothetical protein